MIATRVGGQPNCSTFKITNATTTPDFKPGTDYDFGLPPELQLVPQKIEFINIDEEPDDRFVKPPQPQTPHTNKAKNPFSTKTNLIIKLKLPQRQSLPPEDCPKTLRHTKKEIERLLHNHKKRSRYPEKVIQLTRQAAKEHPKLNVKQLAESLGIPYAIVYYWMGYQSPARLKKQSEKDTNTTD